MRPRRIRRGELQRRPVVGREGHAASMRRRRIRRGEATSGGLAAGKPQELQCGHAEFGVENNTAPRAASRSRTSFNAATPNSAWRTEYDLPAVVSRFEFHKLQCGHAEFGVENLVKLL